MGSEREIEALTVAMIVAPGVYVRNRMFDLFDTPGAKRARVRSSVVRGILRQIARATTMSITTEARGMETVWVLRYAIAELRMTRVVELTRGELAALRLVAERAGVHSLSADASDKDVVAAALAHLLSMSPSPEVSRFAQDIGSTPPPALD